MLQFSPAHDLRIGRGLEPGVVEPGVAEPGVAEPGVAELPSFGADCRLGVL